MARTPIPIVDIPNQGSDNALAAQGVAADSVNNHSLVNDGRVELWVFNRAVGALQVTLISKAEPTFGRTGDIVKSVAADEDFTAGPLKPAGWNQTGADAGLVFVDVDTTDAAMILLGVRRSNAS